MTFNKLQQLLEMLDPDSTHQEFDEAFARSILYPTQAKAPESLSPKQRDFFHLLAEAQAEYVTRPIDVMTRPEIAKKRAMQEIGNCDREHFLVLFLNSRHHIIGSEILFSGTIDRSPVFPREIARAALLKSASCIIVAHNHPSQTMIPSNADIETTKRLIAALDLLGIRLLDHLIVTAHAALSLMETHPEIW